MTNFSPNPLNEVIIYHNPRCGTSRTVLGILQDLGLTIKVIDYLKDPLSADELTALIDRLNIGARELIRSKESVFTELGLGDPQFTDDALITMMAENPILMNRPVVVTAKGAVLCRPAELVHTVL